MGILPTIYESEKKKRKYFLNCVAFKFFFIISRTKINVVEIKK